MISMFYDWLTIYQDHDSDLPFLSDTAQLIYDTSTGNIITEQQPAFIHKGSYSTSLSIKISGRRLTLKGNPSRINRIDNLFGYSTIDQCVAVYTKGGRDDKRTIKLLVKGIKVYLHSTASDMD